MSVGVRCAKSFETTWVIDTVLHAMPDASRGDLAQRAVLSHGCSSPTRRQNASPADGQGRVLAAAEKTLTSADERGSVRCVERVRFTFEINIPASSVESNRRTWFE